MEAEALRSKPFRADAFLPTTTYYELRSAAAGGEYAVWVTLPVGYKPDDGKKYPVVYVQDGNLMAPFIGCFNKVMPVDVISPIRPFIAVSIGYAPDDAAHCSSLRMRDLVPPGEPANPMALQALERNVAAGLMTEKEKDAAVAGMGNNRADLFLRFICDELHPLISSRFNADENDVGLFGYSYGGLFSLYAALNPEPLITKFGACSAGMLTENTVIFSILRQLRERNTELPKRRLLLTINERELTAASFYQTMGLCFSAVSRDLGQSPIPGLEPVSDIIPGTTHVTGTTAAWFRFIREFYSEE